MTVDLKEQIGKALQYHKAGEFIKAEQMYTEILRISPDNYSTLNLLGLLKTQDNQFLEAIAFIKRAAELNPCAYFYESLGRAYYGANKFKEAIDSYKKALTFEEKDFSILFNLAMAYKNDLNYELAIETYKLTLELEPNNPDTHFNLANVYANCNNPEKALFHYKKAREFAIKDDNVNYFIADSYLKQKDFKNGWEFYETRPSKFFATLTQKLQYPELIENRPIWEGQPLEGKTLFVYYEAGLGDTIMYARYLPLLKQTCKCEKILLKPQIATTALCEQSDLGVDVINQPREDMDFDYHIPIMSIPYVLKHHSESDIPFPEGYLKVNTEKVLKYKNEYFDNSNLKIGIKWQGNPAYDRQRIIPLSAFYELFNLPNTKFYSLQKDDGAEELENLPENIELINLGKTFNDFTDTAAAIQNLDLVICNDTSVAHLAGALGKECWVVIPFSPNWRWNNDYTYSPWYKSVKLFRQEKPFDWSGAFDRVLDELKKRI